MVRRFWSGRRLLAGRPALRCILSALALVPCAVPPAWADVRIGGDSNGYYTVNVMSWWELPFRTVVRQRYDFSCGSAAIATLLTYHYDRKTDERTPFKAMWEQGNQDEIRKVGFSLLDMKNYLNGIGYRAEGFRFSMDSLKKLRRPAIVLLNRKGYLHFVVVKGVRGDKVLVGDPTLGLGEYSSAEFAKYWNGILLAIVDPPDKERPRYNLASDWNSRAKARMDANVWDESIGNLTTSLPPTYQIVPQILIDLRPPGGN